MGIAAFLAKILVQHWFNKALESHKLSLTFQTENYKNSLSQFTEKYKSTLNTQLEEHKSNLSKINSEFMIKFTKLQEKRANVISNLYSNFAEIRNLLDAHPATISEEIRDDYLKELGTLYNGAKKSYKCNKIFFPNDISEKVENMLNAFLNESFRRSYFAHYRNSPNSNIKFEELDKEYKRSTQDLDEILGVIENEFRRLLE
jgi:hypothetical protein